jgi:hypothetical protein
MTTTELRQRTPSGYNLALVVPSTQAREPNVDLMSRDALPVLQEARGIVGTLRALSNRMGHGLLAQIAESGEEWTLYHLIFTRGDCGILHITRFRLH